MAGPQLNLERRTGKCLDDAADEAQRVFFDNGGEGLAALLAAAAFSSARRGNGSSFQGDVLRGTATRPSRSGCPNAFALAKGFARETRRQKRGRALKGNFPYAPGVLRPVMLTGAIVFGAIGVAAGFAWDYIIKRDE